MHFIASSCHEWRALIYCYVVGAGWYTQLLDEMEDNTKRQGNLFICFRKYSARLCNGMIFICFLFPWIGKYREFPYCSLCFSFQRASNYYSFERHPTFVHQLPFVIRVDIIRIQYMVKWVCWYKTYNAEVWQVKLPIQRGSCVSLCRVCNFIMNK